MDDSSEETEVHGYDLSFPAEDDDEKVCRICRSPEEPENRLKYPCGCRGSIKFVHEDCLLRWLNRRGYKKCEVCGRSYSFVPVYSENAPERLPMDEFLIGVLSMIVSFMSPIVSWFLVILFNGYCCSLHTWGEEVTAEFQSSLWMSRELASLLTGMLYSTSIVFFLTIITIIRVTVGDLNARRVLRELRAENFTGNGIQQGFIGRVWQVLWKYFKTLCDWYFLKLINFMLQRRGIILRLPNPPLHEFGFIRRMLFFLHDDAFAFLAISVCVPILFVLLPFWIGWIVLATDRGSYLSGTSPFVLGYTMMLLVPFTYFGTTLFTLCQTSLPKIVLWFSHGLRILWVFSVRACKSLQSLGYGKLFTLHQPSFPAIVQWFWLIFHFIKDALVICFKIGVMPWIIGWWLEICTSPLFGTTMSSEILSEISVMYIMMLRWCSGLLCSFIAKSYMDDIQEVIHKRAFWYLLDITDPDYNITKLYLGYTFFAFAFHGVLLVILIHLPLKAITLISPSFFPLKSWITDEEQSLIPIYISSILLRTGPKCLFELTKPAIRLLVHNWIISVSSWLQLSDFLLVVPRGEGFHRADQNARPRRQFDDNPWFPLCCIVECSMVTLHESHNAEDNDTKDQKDDRLLQRIALMLALAALSIFLIGTAFMAVPLLAGRVFYNFIMLRFGFKHDDLCAVWIGCIILRPIYIITCFLFDHIWTGRTNLLLKFVLIWIQKALLFSIWIFVIPGLLGLLIELMIIIPSRVPLDESPVYLLIQDWLIGVIVLHILTFLTMFTPLSRYATKAWQEKLERIRNVGINRLPSMWLLREVIGSIINTLLTTLCITYLLVKALFPLLGFSHSINLAVGRFTWPALLALVTVWFVTKLTRDLISYLHQLLFNERYLVGERVDNFTEV